MSSLPSSLDKRGRPVVSRAWDKLPCCHLLTKVAGSASLQCRTYGKLEKIAEEFAHRTEKYLRMGGFSLTNTARAQKAILKTTLKVLAPWLDSLSPVMHKKELRKARRAVWAGGDGCG